MYIANLPDAITNFQFESEATNLDKTWLKITRVTNIGSISKEIKQKVIRISPEDCLTLYRLLQERFEK